jgi:hypothetical protein
MLCVFMLQDQQQTNQNTAYPTNLYRNVAMDKSGILRLQSKLVPFNPPNTSFRTMVRNVVTVVGSESCLVVVVVFVHVGHPF